MALGTSAKGNTGELLLMPVQSFTNSGMCKNHCAVSGIKWIKCRSAGLVKEVFSHQQYQLDLVPSESGK